jgi:hypothetical protein
VERLPAAAGENEAVALSRGWTHVESVVSELRVVRKAEQPVEMSAGMRIEFCENVVSQSYKHLLLPSSRNFNGEFAHSRILVVVVKYSLKSIA